LLRIAEREKHVDEPEQADHTRVEGVDEGRAAVPLRLVEIQSLFQVGATLDHPTEVVQGGADDTVSSYPRGGIAPILSQLQQIPRSLVRHGQFAPLKVHDELSIKRWEELRHVAQLAAQLARTSVGATGLPRRKAPRGK
jgi:hypothetical protein